MKEKIEQLYVLDDPSVELIVERAIDVKNKYETAKSILDTALLENNVSNMYLKEISNSVISNKSNLDQMERLISDLCDLHRKKIERIISNSEIIIREVDSFKEELLEREKDKELVESLRKEYEDSNTASVEGGGCCCDKTHGCESNID